MVISDLEHLEPISDEIDPEGGFFLSFLARRSPTAIAFTNTLAQAVGPNFAIASSVSLTQAISTPFFSLAIASSTSIAIAG